MTMLEEACKYAQRGWRIFPLKKGTKLPLIEAWQKNATDDIEQIIEWWTQWPQANIAVATGLESGIWVLDIDVKGEDNGIESLRKIIREGKEIPKTLCSKTANDGWHYFFKHDKGVHRNTAGRIPGVDTRGDGGYIVLPPSQLHNKSTYNWYNPDQDILPAPRWLIDTLETKEPKRFGNTTATTGSRNNLLTSLAGRYRRVGLDADAIMSQLIKDNDTKCVPPLERSEIELIANSVARYEPEALDEEVDRSDLLKHITPLGVHEGNYIFYSRNIKCIKSIAAATLATKPCLRSLVGDKLLLAHFPRIDKESGAVMGYNIDKASGFLMEACHAVGTYNPDLVRGIGVWKDNGRIVVNTGKSLNVDGQDTPYSQFNSEYTYDQPDKQFIFLDETLTDDEIGLIFNIMSGFNWVEDYAPYLLLGTLIQSVIGPIFRWRAHSWIIGAQGSGKSYIQFNLIRPLLGSLCRGFEHGTTSAGIRGSLKHNAFTISYDEAEVRDGDDPRIMNQVVGLARISSSEESTVVKGTASGDSIEYRCQSTFIMSSIKPYLKQESDMARFALLEMEPPLERSEEDAKAFSEVTSLCKSIDGNFSRRFVATCIGMIPKIADKRQQIETEMVKLGLSPRTIDQYGQLVACASVALGWDVDLAIFKTLLDETRELTADAEPLRELNRLLGAEIGIPTSYGRETVTISKAISYASKSWTEDKKYDPEEVNELLCTYGIKVEGGYVYIANNSSKIQKILSYTNWGKLFKIIPWVEVGSNCTTFGNRTYKSRFTRFRTTVLDPLDNAVNSSFVDQKARADVGF